jgi:hypothetical protein
VHPPGFRLAKIDAAIRWLGHGYRSDPRPPAVAHLTEKFHPSRLPQVQEGAGSELELVLVCLHDVLGS